MCGGGFLDFRILKREGVYSRGLVEGGVYSIKCGIVNIKVGYMGGTLP